MGTLERGEFEGRFVKRTRVDPEGVRAESQNYFDWVCYKAAVDLALDPSLNGLSKEKIIKRLRDIISNDNQYHVLFLDHLPKEKAAEILKRAFLNQRRREKAA